MEAKLVTDKHDELAPYLTHYVYHVGMGNAARVLASEDLISISRPVKRHQNEIRDRNSHRRAAAHATHEWHPAAYPYDAKCAQLDQRSHTGLSRVDAPRSIARCGTPVSEIDDGS